MADKIEELITILQDHVLARYDSIDAFLNAEGILVNQEFYDLSTALGYTISEDYLE